jgi:hypothetical protein
MRKLIFVQKCVVAILFLGSFSPGFAAAQIKDDPDAGSPRVPAAGSEEYQPISHNERVAWFVNSTVAPKSLAAGIVSTAWGTAMNKPKEYGPHGEGFGKRYGMRLTGVATGNAIEAGLGGLWSEDPRYSPSFDDRPVGRVRHAAAMVFIAHRSDGRPVLAFARYTGIVGGNFISNTWRVPSESTARAAMTRSLVGFGGRFASNLFDEFRQGILRKLHRRQ